MSLHDYLNAVIAEGAADRYRQMFANLPDRFNGTIQGEINHARSFFKREDRIIWYLRFVKLEILRKLSKGGVTPEQDTGDAVVYHKQYKKLVDNLVRKSGGREVDFTTPTFYPMHRAYERDFNHWMSMMDRIPELDRVVWQYQTLEQLFDQFEEIEKRWQEQAADDKRRLPKTEDDYSNAKKIIDFGDGFAWWNLGVSSCDQEGAAMGHCGNTAENEGEVLSLRKRTGDFDEPFLTFIYHDGLLGEMKGRANQKPAAKYHPYIVKLLMHPMIEGIIGGGHAPEHNFAMSDLGETERAKIVKAKPQLGTPMEEYRASGKITESLLQRCKVIYLEQYGEEPSEVIDGHFVIDKANERMVPMEIKYHIGFLSRHRDPKLYGVYPEDITWTTLIQRVSGSISHNGLQAIQRVNPNIKDNEGLIWFLTRGVGRSALSRAVAQITPEFIEVHRVEPTRDEIFSFIKAMIRGFARIPEDEDGAHQLKLVFEDDGDGITTKLLLPFAAFVSVADQIETGQGPWNLKHIARQGWLDFETEGSPKPETPDEVKAVAKLSDAAKVVNLGGFLLDELEDEIFKRENIRRIAELVEEQFAAFNDSQEAMRALYA